MATCTDPDCLVTKAGIGAHNEHPAPVKISGDHVAGVINMPVTAETQRRLNYNASRQKLFDTSTRPDALEMGMAEGKVIPMDLGRAAVHIKRLQSRKKK